MDYIIAGLYYLCFAILVFLAFLVYLKNPQARLNRYFVFFSLSLLGWLVSLFIFNRLPDTNLLTLVGRINLAFAAFAVLFGYIFLPEIAKKHDHFAPFLFGETVILSFLTIGTGLIDRVEHISQTGQHETVFGSLYFLYALHIITYILGALYFIFLKKKGITGKAKSQLEIVGLGIFFTGIIATITTSILPYIFNVFAFQEIGALTTVFLLGAIAYSITAHQLFDIRVVVKRTIIYSVLLAFALATYSMVVFILTSTLGSNSSSAFEPKTFFTNLVAAGLIAVGYGPLQKWLQEKTDGWLFKKEYQEQEIIQELGKKLNNVIALDEALEIMMQTVVKVLHLKHAATFVFQPGESGQLAVKRIKQIGYSSITKLYLDEKDVAFQYFNEHPGILTAENLHQTIEKEFAKLNYIYKKNPKELTPDMSQALRAHSIKEGVLKRLESLNIELAIPLRLGDQPLGLILLSGKQSGDAYSKEDITFLETIGSQTISSIQKAKLYEGDQMKSEFVSIASHELLTPITAIEGYLDMILNEHLGKVDSKARSYLEKVFTSSKRLSLLVKDLLSVSRIEAGRMKVELQQLNMNKMIGDTMDQLKFMAAEKKLKLSYEGPENLPPVWADSDRTMQVLVNLVSNAIKYTPEGSITIKASQGGGNDPHIRVDVIDTGLGMTKQAQAHLFEKFYRIASPETTGITGTGLGLYITKSLVERMGGFMDVHSVTGKGSTFSFTLPLFKVEESKAAGEKKK